MTIENPRTANLEAVAKFKPGIGAKPAKEDMVIVMSKLLIFHLFIICFSEVIWNLAILIIPVCDGYVVLDFIRL